MFSYSLCHVDTDRLVRLAGFAFTQFHLQRKDPTDNFASVLV